MFHNSTILITGGTGSWGNELVNCLLTKYGPKEIRIYSRGEHRQVEMKRKFGSHKNLKFIIGDVRDKNILKLSMKNVDYVFHLAALKHVPICEENTWEAVLTNIYGTQNVIESAIDCGVKKVVDISTDKAVDPFNLYGMTKACGEKMVVNAGFNYVCDTKFVCIRGGNVIGTNGSVIPLFKKQILEDNCITITDPQMTRYLMSTKQAIELVIEAVLRSLGGEIFVMRMPATTVQIIADSMRVLFGNSTTKEIVTGCRPGEKLHESLVSKNEAPHTKIVNDDYFVILPMNRSDELEELYRENKFIAQPEFTSENAKQLDKDSLIGLLKKESWLWPK
jgi:UDP-N-acetylglucosamine 4,6-dehydratase